MKTYRRIQPPMLLFAIAASLGLVPLAASHADEEFSAKSGKIAFDVDANISFLKVSGQSANVKGGGEPELNGDRVVVRNIKFEVDPKTLKTGIKLRDEHMYEKVFTASDGSIPTVVLRAEQFEAAPNGKSSTWEGNLRGQLTIRGVTRPVSFRATLAKNGEGAVVNATGTINTSDFGVKPISYSGAAVNEEVTITVTDLKVGP